MPPYPNFVPCARCTHPPLANEGRDRVMAELRARFHCLCVLRDELVKTG